MPRAKKTDQPLTTAQQLGSLIKSARTIMRRDKGLSSDLDRLPMLTWIMFLKFLDDMERLEEERAELAGNQYRAAIEAPYRWRDWAAPSDGITGDELTAFVTYEDCLLPDGRRGPGLLPYLRVLQGINGDGAKRRSVIGAVFKDVQNRMLSGYLLRDVVNKVNSIHFLAREELFTLGHMYETMLREMRDAAGDSGEFYTPRPVVRFMVTVSDPKLGETVLDPACGTGGFLAEAYQHLETQCQTVEDRRTLQEGSLYGGEAKPLPYLLCQMNLLLHGLEAPQIDPGNSLRYKLTELGDRDRVDVILTNPPFGGEEEPGIKGNFPSDMQTSETALLFLQLIMRKLRRPSPGATNGGRAAVVVPDGVLSQQGVATRVRQFLLENFDLHTVVRLPRGVFEPYSKIGSNLLFFEAGRQTKSVWFYDVPVRSGLKQYTKQRPFSLADLGDCSEWWRNRRETERAWLVSLEEIRDQGFTLDFSNPQRDHVVGPDTKDVAADVRQRLSGATDFCRAMTSFSDAWSTELDSRIVTNVPFGDIAEQVKRAEFLFSESDYRVLGMSWYGKGLYIKHTKAGSEIRADKLYRVQEGDFLYNRLFAWKGSFAEALEEHEACFVSSEYPTFLLDRSRVAPGYLWAYFSQAWLWDYIEKLSTGTSSTSRLRLKEHRLREFSIPLPPLEFQESLARLWQEGVARQAEIEVAAHRLTDLVPSCLARLREHPE